MKFDLCQFHEDMVFMWYVAPKKKYPTPVDVSEAIDKVYGCEAPYDAIYDGYVAYRLCMDEDGGSAYTFVEENERGAFPVWIADIEELEQNETVDEGVR